MKTPEKQKLGKEDVVSLVYTFKSKAHVLHNITMLILQQSYFRIYPQVYRNICEGATEPQKEWLSPLLFAHNSNLIAKVAAAKNAPLSLNLTNEHFSGNNFGINPGPKLPDIAKGSEEGGKEGRPRPTQPTNEQTWACVWKCNWNFGATVKPPHPSLIKRDN